MSRIEEVCRQENLLTPEAGNIVRVPFLVKGSLRAPPSVDVGAILEAFEARESKTGKAGRETTWVRLKDAQVLREPVIDRATLEYTGEYIYQILPVFDPEEVIERDLDKLAAELYTLPFQEVLDYLGKLSGVLATASETVEQVRELSRRTAELPDVFLDAAFAGLGILLSPDLVRDMVENELSGFGHSGASFLDSWVKVPAEVLQGLAQRLAQACYRDSSGHDPVRKIARLRAMPTRQLHITAGNAPAVPIVSALRAIGTKSAAVIKSPYGATLPGALLAAAACSVAPDHPITRSLSVVYWPGGDEAVEGPFFLPGAFDRIVVWGAPDAVASVRKRAMFTKIVCLNPRYGMSWIGREAFEPGALQGVAARAAVDTMIWNQKACIASLVHYVEGGEEEALDYAQALHEALTSWDRLAPNFVSPHARGQIRRLRRGKFLHAKWLVNPTGKTPSSAVVVLPGEFNLLDHPMSRVVVVRPVAGLEDVFPLLHHGVSVVGLFPEPRRQELCDRILARGVSSVLPLGECESMYGGMAHDGMKVLSELVDWKNI